MWLIIAMVAVVAIAIFPAICCLLDGLPDDD